MGRKASSAAVITLLAFGLFLTSGTASAMRPGGTARLWTRIYDGPAQIRDIAHDVASSPDGSKVFVTGASGSSDDGLDYATMGYASDGSRLWTARFDGPSHLDDEGWTLGVSPDGTTVFVTGFGTYGTRRNVYTLAYDATTGSRLWKNSYGTKLASDNAYSLDVSPDGSLVVFGGDTNGASGTNQLTVALDTSTGHVVWSRRHNGPDHLGDFGYDLRFSPDGATVFAVGSEETDGGNSTNAFTVAYDAATGATVWHRRYDDTYHLGDQAYAVQVAPDGAAVYVAMASESPTSAYDYVTFAYDAATGAELWHNTYDGPSHDVDQPSAIEVSPDGATVLVTGRTHQRTVAFFDFGTVAIDATTGHRLWVARYDHAGVDDEARAMGVSPDGTKTFVTGLSYNAAMGSPTRAHYATQVYDTVTGDKLGVWRFAGACRKFAVPSGLAVGTDRLFVTGSLACGGAFAGDYATVAYPIP